MQRAPASQASGAWRALIDAVPQLEWVESYGDFDLHTPAHAVSAGRLILVLRRRANS